MHPLPGLKWNNICEWCPMSLFIEGWQWMLRLLFSSVRNIDSHFKRSFGSFWNILYFGNEQIWIIYMLGSQSTKMCAYFALSLSSLVRLPCGGGHLGLRQGQPRHVQHLYQGGLNTLLWMKGKSQKTKWYFPSYRKLFLSPEFWSNFSIVCKDIYWE